MKKVMLFLLTIFSSFALQTFSDGMPTMVLRQPETVISLIYREVPKSTTINPQDFEIGQTTNCQIWSIVAQKIFSRSLIIQIDGLIPWGISRGQNCPSKAMVRGYSDGRVELKSKSTILFDGEVLIVASLKPISVKILEPFSSRINGVFSSNGKIIPILSTISNISIVLEVKVSPSIPLLSLYTEGNWNLYESWEMPETGWTRIELDYWESPFLAPPEIASRAIGRRNIVPLVKETTSWGSLKAGR